MAYLVAGMIVFWIVTFVFVLSVLRRERKLEQEVELLRQTMSDQPQKQ
jgi:CcmD family protein